MSRDAGAATDGVRAGDAMGASDASPGPPDPFSLVAPQGLGVNIHFSVPEAGAMKALAGGGFRWIRMDLYWEYVEKEKGKYDFSRYDQLVAGLDEWHIRALFILDYANPLYPSDDHQQLTTDEARSAFAAFSAAAVARYRGRGYLWEIWNEPNGAWQPADYAKLVKVTAEAVRKVAPEERVIGPALGHRPGTSPNLTFLEGIFQNGVLGYFAAVSVHPYIMPPGLPEDAGTLYGKIRALMTKYAPTKKLPIISGEWGYYTGSGGWAVSETEQAARLTRVYLTNLLNGVPISIWYEWKDDPKVEPWGVMKSGYYPERDLVYEPKRAYSAAATLASLLDGYLVDKQLSGAAGDHVITLKRADRQPGIIVVAWTTRSSHSLTIPSAEFDGLPAPVTMRGNTGEDLGEVTATWNGLTVSVTSSPVYLLASPPAAEVVAQSWRFHPSRTTDMDGDGAMDLCVRAAAGVNCYRAGSGTAVKGPEWSDANGWSDASNYTTIRMGDIDGDGKADWCGRAKATVTCALSTGSGVGTLITGPALSDAAGWGKALVYSTIELVDVDGDKRADLCARKADGFSCWMSTGSGFGSVIVLDEMADANGWGAWDHVGTIRMGDVNGDGRTDVCGRGHAGVACWIWNGKRFSTKVTGPAWSDAAGWGGGDYQYWSTIQLADIDGDKKADLCARGRAGFECALSTGSGFKPVWRTGLLGDAGGWSKRQYFSTIRLGDLDNDGKADLCARGPNGLHCWRGTGGGFADPPLFVASDFSDGAGFDEPQYYRTINLADVNGDKRADVCARWPSGYACLPSEGTRLGALRSMAALTDAWDWYKEEYYLTIRLAGMR